MSVEVLPVGVACNLKCDYCYEEDIRTRSSEQGTTRQDSLYNRPKVLKTLQNMRSEWSLFGGEALLLPMKDLEELLELGYKQFGKTGVQTNGTLITEAHIDLFEKYHTRVGISVDGPVELNDSRWAGNEEATRKLSEKSHWAIRRLAERSKTIPHLLPSIIVTLHAGNCGETKFPIFVEWLKELDEIGIQYVNLHLMELDSNAHVLYLHQSELCKRLIELWNVERTFKNLKLTKFQEILALLQGNDQAAQCVWHACDPLATAAVQSVDNNGCASLCARTFKGGKKWLPAEGSSCSQRCEQAGFPEHPTTRYYERQLSLYVTPQEYGGCKDCRFWMMCKGQCPGEGEHNDWRERSHYCDTYKQLFTVGEQKLVAEGVTPVSLYHNREELELHAYDYWARGINPSLKGLIAENQGTLEKYEDVVGHRDHYDGHGDSPHGDHTDIQNEVIDDAARS